MPLVNREYRDINLNFIPHPGTGDIDILKDAEAVKRSVKNLVLTNFYERPFQPNLGCGIAQLLFEPMTQITESQIKLAIEEVIRAYEPRALIISTVVKADIDYHRYSATITFSIASIREPLTISLFLERVR